MLVLHKESSSQATHRRPSMVSPRQLWGKSPEIQTLCEPVCRLLLLLQMKADRQD
jgi:hypothetical protein